MQNANGFGLMGGTFQLGKPGLVAGTTTTHTITTAFTYVINGKSYSKGAGSNTATPTVDVVTGAAFKGLVANQACLFVFCLNAAGTISVAQGAIVDNREIGAVGGSVGAPIPNLPDTLCPIATLLAQAGPTTVGTWLFGTNNLSGVTGLTYTFQDVFSLPVQPVTV